MKTQCPHCQSQFVVKGEFIGRTATCKACNKQFTLEPVVTVENLPEREPAATASPRPASAPATEAGSPVNTGIAVARLVIGIVGAVAGAALGGAIWVGLAVATGYEHMAYGLLCGGLGGFAALYGNGRKNVLLGVVTAAVVITACLASSYISYSQVSREALTLEDFERDHPLGGVDDFYKSLSPKDQDAFVRVFYTQEHGKSQTWLIEKRRSIHDRLEGQTNKCEELSRIEWFTARCESLCVLFRAADYDARRLDGLTPGQWAGVMQDDPLMRSSDLSVLQTPRVTQAVPADSPEDRRKILRGHISTIQSDSGVFMQYARQAAKALRASPNEGRDEIIAKWHPKWQESMNGRLDER